MNYTDLQTAARAMPPEVVAANLKSMMEGDARFVAVIAWLDNNREGFIAAGSNQKLAKEHGPLAHCQGSIHALRTLEGQLRELIAPSPRRRPAPPEAE